MKSLMPPLLAALALAGFSTAAIAADPYAGGPPPPPPMEYHAPAVGGWYLRGDIGVGIHNNLDWSHKTGKFGLETTGDTVFWGAGVGYQFSHWFRADVTGEYRAKFKTTAREFVGCCYQLNWDGQVSAAVGLANVYVDLGSYWGLTPYIGAGAGLAHVMTHGWRGDAHALDEGKTNFAWAVHAGLSYDVKPNFKVDLGYRYTDLGDAKTGKLVCPCGGDPYPGIKTSHLESHDLRLGVRWVFAHEPAYAPAPASVKY